MRKIKVLKIIAVCIAVFCAMLFITVRIYYHDFYIAARKEFKVPALSDDFIPQGLEYCEEDKVYLISGYQYKTGEARIYVVNPDGSYRRINILDQAGVTLLCHSGGICAYGDYIYLAGSKGRCFVLSSQEILKEKKDSVKILGKFNTKNNASFCYAKNDHLYVGEYYHYYKYQTDTSHHFTTPAEDNNKALILEYSLNKEDPYGISPIPSAAYSITDRVQGMCITDDGKFVLSASSVLEGSQLYIYDQQSIESQKRSSDIFTLSGIDIPIYYIDKDSLMKTVQILPKSEELLFSNNRLYMIFESASRRFLYGNLLGAQNVYSVFWPELLSM